MNTAESRIIVLSSNQVFISREATRETNTHVSVPSVEAHVISLKGQSGSTKCDISSHTHFFSLFITWQDQMFIVHNKKREEAGAAECVYGVGRGGMSFGNNRPVVRLP